MRKILDEFMKSSMDSYKPGTYITIHEQLLAFQVMCTFRMCIPTNPANMTLNCNNVRCRNQMYDQCNILFGIEYQN